MRELFRALLDAALPPACALCRRAPSPGPLCPPCVARIPWVPAGLCPRCEERPPETAGGCGRCRSRSRRLRACRAGAFYEGEVEALVRRFKYPEPGLRGLDPGPAAACAELVRRAAERAARDLGAVDRVVPVPLHPRRLSGRGMNPACELARAAARHLGCPLEPVALERRRDTPSQTGLSRRARRANVRGAFRARKPVPARILLVDDVVTTGATLDAAAAALRAAGARALAAACAARTPGRAP